ncbi:phosphomannomutase/phosphoglucomutase [Candidatus Dojkabacteria bacterium]|nr:phosphomannomutase/phosphoglucomutase [Candidatus Dojkabacteria bacterium]
MNQQLLDSVFHAYDIRGKVPEELDEAFFEILGKTFVEYLNAKNIVVGYDIRPESKGFHDAFAKGAISAGCNVTSIGEIGTELLYFAVGSNPKFDGGVVVTASHNPAGWNGCKLVGKDVSFVEISKIKNLMSSNLINDSENTNGTYSELDIFPAYKSKVLSFLGDVKIKPMKVIVDAGNGIGGKLFDYIFSDLPLSVTRMYFEPDGTFPNHVADPMKEENVSELKKRVKVENFDLGIAFDADADRVFFIDSKGRNPTGEYTGVVLAKELLKKEPEDSVIVHDPRIVWPIINELKKVKAKAAVCKPGHIFFKQKMRELNAVFGMEMSSHFFYRDFYYADSGMITTVIFLKLLSGGFDFTKEMDYYYENYPNSGEVNYTVSNVADVLAQVKLAYPEGKLDTTDGIGVSFGDWRFSLRASNTQPLIRLNVEATSVPLVIENFKEIEHIIDGKRDNIPVRTELR